MTKTIRASTGFVRLRHDVLDSPAWRTASHGMQRAVIAIWERHYGSNNGQIVFGKRQVQAALHCGSTQAVRYVAEAQERGFIVSTKRGSFDWKAGARKGKATTWRLTMEACDGRPATDEWAEWTPPENAFDGSRSETRTGPGARPIRARRVPERDPSAPFDGSRSETTSKISYQGKNESASTGLADDDDPVTMAAEVAHFGNVIALASHARRAAMTAPYAVSLPSPAPIPRPPTLRLLGSMPDSANK